jgi:hypothetical protein
MFWSTQETIMGRTVVMWPAAVCSSHSAPGRSAIWTILALVLLAAGPAYGQHGVLVGKSCETPLCPGDSTDCSIVVGHADFFGDTIAIQQAFDIVDPGPGGDNVRVPPVGNLPIVGIFGNTTCTVGGSLPCLIGEGGSALGGLPGDPNPGLVTFASDTYIPQPDDPNPLPHQASVVVMDLCDAPGTLGCSSLLNTLQFTAAAEVLDCDDADGCTIDTCRDGACDYEDVICDDGDACTTQACNSKNGECEVVDVVNCDDGDACTTQACNPKSGECDVVDVVQCDDGDGCTTQACDPQTGRCQVIDTVDCSDSNACTTELCNPESGECEYPGIPGCQDCNLNDIPDDVDLENCPGQPACADCNLNGVPDECDIASGIEEDEDEDGVPDDCTQFVGGCGESNINWSCVENWDLNGVFPNNGPQSNFHVTLNGNDHVFLDLSVEIDTLQLRDNSQLDVTQVGSGDLRIAGPGGMLLEGRMFMGGPRGVRALIGPVKIRSGGRFERSPEAPPGSVTGGLQAVGLTIEPGGVVKLTDSLEIRLQTGSLILDGSSLVPPCPNCGGDAPPILDNPSGGVVFIEGDLVLMGNIEFAYGSDSLLSIGGDFVNHSIVPESFHFSHGFMQMAGPPGQHFEVGGENIGATLEGFAHPDGHSNFSVGAVEVLAGGPAFIADTIFENTFDNIAGTGACAEALYVHTLILRPGSEILIDDCVVYYETLVNEGGTIQLAGCGALTELPACASSSDCDDANPCFFDSCEDGTCDFVNSGPVGCADLDGDGIRDDNCVWWSCNGAACQGTPIMFADMGGQFGTCEPDGATDGNDRFHALNCFANVDTAGNSGYPCEGDAPHAYNVDAGGQFGSCSADGVCDGNDAFAAINAFNGTTPCSCPSPPMPTAPALNPPLDRAALRLAATQKAIAPGETVDVDVQLAGDLSDLRGYQLHLAIRGGDSGALQLVDISVREPSVFSGAAWSAFNVRTAQMVAGLDGPGIAAPAGATLATFTLRADSAAAGAFSVDLFADADDPGQRTYLFPTPAQGRIAVTAVEPATVRVAPAARPARPERSR